MKNSENTLTNLKILSSRIAGLISTKLGTMHPRMKGIQVYSYEEQLNSHKVKAQDG